MFRYAATHGIRVLDFGDEVVVFNPLSWDAHILNAAAAAVLDLLMLKSCSLNEVEDLLSEIVLEAERPHATDHARRLLQELTQLRLVQAE